jgi:hypothetical protein
MGSRVRVKVPGSEVPGSQDDCKSTDVHKSRSGVLHTALSALHDSALTGALVSVCPTQYLIVECESQLSEQDTSVSS